MKIQLLIGLGLTILFVGSTFITLFGAGQSLQAVLKTYVFQVEDCKYDYAPRPVNPEEKFIEPKEICFIDYNRTKKDVAEGLAMFLVSAPIAGFAFWQGKKLLQKED